jgi:Fe-S-cluster-containing hydrogenase component 2
VLKGFLDAFMNLTDPRPSFTGERCLVEKNAVGGCDKCMQACPHDAVRIGSSVEILEGDCTGCGLCVQACPTGALEYDVLKSLSVLKQQGATSANAPSSKRVPCSLKCSKVPGDGATLECLGRVTPAMLMASAAWGQRLTLARGDCDTCKLGGPSVPLALENVVEITRAYREHLEAEPMDVRVVQYGVESPEPSSDAVRVGTPTVAVSRRGALQAMAQNTRGGVARVIPDRIIPGVDTKPEVQAVPDEWVWRRKALRPTPEPETLQYWPTPTVNDACIFCPVCQNVCPTNAITRDREMDGSYQIKLEVAACTGCNACVLSCPPSAMTLEAKTPTLKLNETVVLHEGSGYDY